MVFQLMFWWPGLLRVWKRAKAGERENFPDRKESKSEGGVWSDWAPGLFE